jgi:hypothetical protein
MGECCCEKLKQFEKTIKLNQRKIEDISGKKMLEAFSFLSLLINNLGLCVSVVTK